MRKLWVVASAAVLAFSLCAASWMTPVAAVSPFGATRTLVVLDSDADKDRYSVFLKTLSDRGFELFYKTPSTPIELIRFEMPIYNHLIIFASSANSFKGEFTTATILEFQNKGGNVLVAGSSSISEFIRDLAIEYSVEFDERSWAVRDAFHTPDSTDPLLISSSRFVGNDVVLPADEFKRGNPQPVLFRGVGHRLTGRNPLITPILTGHSSAFAAPVKAPASHTVQSGALTGSSLVLVSALQARNNARIVFTGSADMFSDELIKKKIGTAENSNFNFVTELSKWVFREKGVLKVVKTYHHRPSEDKQHGAYRIKDELVYEIDIAEYRDNAWQPFHTSDLQFEAVMLDPYIRANITEYVVVPHVSGELGGSIRAGRFISRVKLPDVYGVFTFKVDYKRHGLSWIEASETVAIHPFRHNEYPRFLSAAYPYYVNSFSMIAGFFVLSIVVLYHAESKKTAASKVKTN
ncbi:Dolichyl-diphosphooligosaccharide--protein glycosyltransferase subunit WBP1 [Zopfochytrium polystomum]|nr:Dolichyl-diphosphooligosaccharide--protein glycosyltransferase subunit WBP1 [Zopfochytrium polystomum]